MHEAKNTQRSLVRIGYDGRVHKLFRGPEAEKRYANEIRVLEYLAERDCPFVPRVLEKYPDRLEVVLTNCGSRVQQISEEKVKQVFGELAEYGVQHDDPFDRNITYRGTDGRFCIIDFEFATIIDPAAEQAGEAGQLAAAGDRRAAMAGRQRGADTQTLEICWSARSHRGRFRKNNEDVYLTTQIRRNGLRFLGVEGCAGLTQDEWVFAVSDGMGGERSGEFASQITAARVASSLPRYVGQFSPQSELTLGIVRSLFIEIHENVMSLGYHDANLRNMGATLTLVWIRGTTAYYGHIGDSRLYHLPAGGPLKQLTDDDTHAHWLYRKGELNERQFREHPRRSVLGQSIGAGHRYLNPQVGFFHLAAGDRLLLCTDGVIDGHFDRGLTEMLVEPPPRWAGYPPAERLVLSAVEQSGRDNASAVVVELRSSTGTA